MRRAVLASLLLVAAACGGGGQPVPAPTEGSPIRGGSGPIQRIDVDLRALEGSDVTGRVHIKTIGAEAGEMTIELEGASDEPLKVHTHSGPCTADPTEPTHEIPDPVVDGRVKTQIGASVQGLTHGGFNISIHANNDGNSQHIACGEVAPGIVLEE